MDPDAAAGGRPPGTLIRARLGFTLSLLLPGLPPLGHALGVLAGETALFSLFTPFFVFAVVGLLDQAIGRDTSNPGTDDRRLLHADPCLRGLPVLVLPECLILIIWGANVVSDPAHSAATVAGTILSVGNVTGALGITAAHELIHKTSRWERAAGGLLLALVCYGTFKIEHVRGHHRTVSTPLDRSSARKGEWLYPFLYRSIRDNVASAWALETQRLRRSGANPWGHRNEIVVLSACSIVAALAVASFAGRVGLLFFAGQSLVAVLLLEIVNYIQHYGLRRRQLPDGRYERVTPRHSWNSPFRLTNWLLFNLERHSDHHAVAARRYGALLHHEGSPQLPAGYASMVLLALVPPLWFRVMDARLGAYTAEGGDPSPG